MYKYLLLLLLFCLPSSFFAQQNKIGTKIPVGSVFGNLLDNVTGKPLPFASIGLKILNDSAQMISQVSDKNGAFDFEKLRFGYYRLTIDMVGYSKNIIDSIHIHSAHFDVNLNEVKLNDSNNPLNEVIVYSEKPMIENKEGKIIYNVSESPLSNGSNAAEMLKNLPLMNSNPDGTLLLRGKEPLILMDEKPVHLNGQQLADLLESLPSNVIEKVEIMLNPPPEYATYPGGVINIITRKGKIGIYEKIGISGGTRGESAISGIFNYRSSKLNISSSLGLGSLEVRGNSYSHRQNIYKDSINYFYSQSAFINKSQHPNTRVEVNYDFTKKSNLSFVYQGNLNNFNNTNNRLFSNRDSLLNVYKASSRNNQYEGNGYLHGFSTSYQWKGKNPVEKLQVYSGISFSKNENNADFYQQFLQADFLPTGLDSTQVQITDNFVTSFYLNGNYNKPLNDTGTTYITVGSSFTSSEHHNILSTEFLRKADQLLITNALLSNNFYYHQAIFTMRAALVIGLPFHWRMIGGVNAENTSVNFQFVKGNAPDANNSYFQILPNFTIRKEFNKQFNMSFVIRQTIRRPGMMELNPSVDYSDPYNIRFGNPYLLPALINNLDFNLSYVKNKFSINGSMGYNRVSNVFNSIRTLVDSGKTQITFQNISDQEEYLVSFWTGCNLSRNFRVSISGGYNYNKYGEREKQLYKYVDAGGFYTTFNYSYTPDNLTIIEANNRYNSFANPQGKARSNVTMSISVLRKFYNKRLMVGVSAIDPFGLERYQGYSAGSNFTIESYSVTNTQNFRLSLSYQLSRTLIKSKLTDKDKTDALNKLGRK